ncbi:exo-alpha-sialidase [Oxalobacteraceae bacterium A2-2]
MRYRFLSVTMLCAVLAGAAAAAPGLPSLDLGQRYVWDSVAIGGGGFVSAIIPARDGSGVLYARTDVGGAYRWDAAAARWQPLLDWLPDDSTGYLGIDALAVDPHDAARVYLLAGTGYLNGGKTAILRSSDYGRSFAVTDVTAQFKTHGNGMGRGNGEKLAVDPGAGEVLYAGTRWNGLFRSVDAGLTWQRLPGLDVTATPNGAGISFVLPDPASVAHDRAQRLYVGVSRDAAVGPNLYRSDDGGASFAPVAGAPRLMPQRAALDGAGHLYLSYANGAGPHPSQSPPEPMDDGALWQYRIADGAWRNVTPPGVKAAFSGIAADPRNPQRLLASTISAYLPQGSGRGDRLFLSSDGGASWTDLVARGFAKDAGGVPWIAGRHAIHWASSIVFDPADCRAAWVTSGNGVFRSADLGAVPTTWTFTVAGLEETVPLAMASLPGGPLVTAIGDYDGFLHTEVRRYAPIHQPEMGTTTGLDYAAARPSVLVRVGAAMYTSSDMGRSWRRTPAMRGAKGQVALSADGAVILHSPEDATLSYRSDDMGASWSVVRGLEGRRMRAVADSVNPRRFYAYQDGVLLASSDGGVSFAPRARLAPGGSDLVRAAPGHEGDVWVALRAGGLARSTDAGASFALLAAVQDCGAVGFGKAAPGASYPAIYIWGTVGGVRGVFRSTDTGASWVRVNDDAHAYGGPGDGHFILGDMNSYGVVYMSTAGRGVVVGRPAQQAAAPERTVPH